MMTYIPSMLKRAINHKYSFTVKQWPLSPLPNKQTRVANVSEDKDSLFCQTLLFFTFPNCKNRGKYLRKFPSIQKLIDEIGIHAFPG